MICWKKETVKNYGIILLQSLFVLKHKLFVTKNFIIKNMTLATIDKNSTHYAGSC